MQAEWAWYEMTPMQHAGLARSPLTGINTTHVYCTSPSLGRLFWPRTEYDPRVRHEYSTLQFRLLRRPQISPGDPKRHPSLSSSICILPCQRCVGMELDKLCIWKPCRTCSSLQHFGLHGVVPCPAPLRSLHPCFPTIMSKKQRI